MELRSRSRSKTPLLITNIDKEMYDTEDHVETVVRTTRSSTFKTMESHKYKANTRSSKSKATQRKYFTSDYSSEDGDTDSSTSRITSQNIRNQFIEENINNHTESGVSALKVYKEAGEYWNKYPKTDYTYSRHSKDRIELAPGVVAMPNMSRRSLHTAPDGTEMFTANKQTNTDIYCRGENVRAHAKPRALFSNNNYDESTEYSRTTRRTTQNVTIIRRIARTIVSTFSAIFAVFYFAYTIQRSMFIQVAKWIHGITSVVMLWDTRLLNRWSVNRSNRKLHSLLLLILIPFLLLAGWWLANGTTTYVYEAYKIAVDSMPTIGMGGIGNGIERANNDPPKVILESIVNEEMLLHRQRNENNAHIDADELIQKILNSPKLQEIIRFNNAVNKKLDAVAVQLQKDLTGDLSRQQLIVDSLRDENQRIRLAIAEQASATKQHLNLLMNQMQARLNKCCSRSLVNVEGDVLKLLKTLFSMPDHVVTQEDAQSWLRSFFVAKTDLEARIERLTSHLSQDFNKLIASNTRTIMEDVTNVVSRDLSRRFESGGRQKEVIVETIAEDRIKEIVTNALAVYDADKTGLVDYAMEPSGGQIISTRCTETYNTGTAVISILGIGLWNPVNTPRTVITPGIKPGECWAFQNFPGYLIIKLLQPIRIEMFSYEHISRLLVPNGKLTSAPKEFSVFGLRHEEDKESIEIGRFVYDVNGSPLQYFPVHNSSFVYQVIELVIHNNNGNPNYTCLYRFRVHGTPVAEPT